MNSKKATNAEDIKPENIIRIYRERLKVLKRAQEFSQADDIPRAVKEYSQYLNCLAQYFDTDETKLDPKLFDQERDVAELLLISHVYWDLAKAYDRSPKLQNESIRCLSQFAKFSSGYKFQYVNAQMVKNFIRKKLAHNPKAFKDAYKQIQVESKGCFIATYCFGSNHEITNTLRSFKFKIVNTTLGFKFIELYYHISPRLILIFEKNKLIGNTLKYLLLRPLLGTIAAILKATKK